MSRGLPLALSLLVGFAPIARADGPEADPAPEVEETGTHERDLSIGFGIDLFSLDRHDDETHMSVLDLFIVSAFEMERRDDFLRVEFLDAPLITTLKRKRDGPKRSLRILDVPLFTLFRSDRVGDEEVDVRFFELPIIGSVYSHRKNAQGERTSLLFLFHRRESTGLVSQP